MDKGHDKTIVIIGGGIGGMAALHCLKRKYAADHGVRVMLLEASGRAGGTIETTAEDGFTFEAGPNGFLDSKPRTRQFISEIGLERQQVEADESAKKRFICSEDKLYELPASPADFFKFPLLTVTDKLRVLGEFFIGRGRSGCETIYDFGYRRFGKRFTDIFLDSMVSGIFAGDTKKLVLKSAFPRLAELEQKFGSLFLAQFALRKGKKNHPVGSPQGKLCSFQYGMGEVIGKLYSHYWQDVKLNVKVTSVRKDPVGYTVFAGHERIRADAVIGAAPAYSLAPVFLPMDAEISAHLEKITYAPVGVVGLGYDNYALPAIPRGFGYLIPSQDNKEVLGVLFEHNIFPARFPKYHAFFRVMIGGARRPEVAHYHGGEIEEIAKTELKYTLGITAAPRKTFVKIWPRAIPQYDCAHEEARKVITEQLGKYPGVHFAANFWNGISFNDCIENAYQIAQAIELGNFKPAPMNAQPA